MEGAGLPVCLAGSSKKPLTMITLSSGRFTCRQRSADRQKVHHQLLRQIKAGERLSYVCIQ